MFLDQTKEKLIQLHSSFSSKFEEEFDMITMASSKSKEEVAVKEVHDHAGGNNGSTADKLSYEIFSILESKFLFGYTDPERLLYLPREPAPPVPAPPRHVSLQRGRVCILSIDGNPSIHAGIMASKALSYLEQALRLKSSDPEARISDYFDLVAGTGVGGVLSAMLFSSDDGSRPRFTADDTWCFLTSWWQKLLARKTHKKSTFLWQRNKPIRLATRAMEAAMKQLFGDRLTLRDTLKPVLIPCCDLQTSAPFVFSRADAIESESFNFRLWEVCRAAWAEPGRFEPGEARSLDGKTVCFGIDGGLVMSNPACVAITHVLHNKQEFPFVRGVEDVLVVSLGCGSGSCGELVTGDWRKWGPKDWARPVARIAADGAAEFTDHAVAMAFGEHRAANYVRIQAYSAPGAAAPDATGNSGFSSLDPVALEEATEHMLKQKNVESVLFSGKRIADCTNKEMLDKVAGELIQEHRTRKHRIAPTVVVKQVSSSEPS